MDHKSSSPATVVSAHRRIVFSLQTLMLLVVAIAVAMAWYFDHRQLKKQIWILQQVDPEVALLFDQKVIYWRLRQSLIDATPAWDDRQSEPPLTVSGALAKTDEVVEELNRQSQPLKIGDWKLSSLELIRLSHEQSARDRWGYTARFQGVPLNRDEDGLNSFAVLILMNGAVYGSNVAITDPEIKIGSLMRSKYPFPPLESNK